MQLVAQIYSDPAEDIVVGSIFNLVMTFSPPISQSNSERQAEARGSGKKKVVRKGSQEVAEISENCLLRVVLRRNRKKRRRDSHFGSY